jgi:hypothetical protein
MSATALALLQGDSEVSIQQVFEKDPAYLHTSIYPFYLAQDAYQFSKGVITNKITDGFLQMTWLNVP